MKTLKTFAFALAAAAASLFLSGTATMTVNAAEPVTYAVKYNANLDEWRMQKGTNVFDDNAESREVYYMQLELKAGDTVVVYSEGECKKELYLGLKDQGLPRLGNLTVRTDWSVIYTGGVDNAYVLAGTSCSINGNVTNANVYDTAVATFSNNVGTLNIYGRDDGSDSSVSVGGTVGHLYVVPTNSNIPRTFYNLYNFKAGSLNLQEGTLMSQSWQYMTAEEYALQNPNTATPEEPAAETPAQSVPAADDDEYDDVPKTGQSYLYLWFLGAAALCFAGSRAVRRTDK